MGTGGSWRNEPNYSSGVSLGDILAEALQKRDTAMFYITLEYPAYRDDNRKIADIKEFRSLFLQGCEEGKMSLTKSKNIIETLYQARVILGVRVLKVYLSPAQFANYALTVDIGKRANGDCDFTVADADFEVKPVYPSEIDVSRD